MSRTEYSGINRRATALLPPPRYLDAERIDFEDALDHRRFLLSIEAKQQTVCLRINSELSKSRSGILIFRGRVLGCVYRNRGLDQYLFGAAAYRNAISDLAGPERILEGYHLQEDLAIATASLFHGYVLEVPEQAAVTEIFDLTYGYLEESRMPGCIVLSSADEQSVYMIYLFEGRTIGVYSVRDGWQDSLYEGIKADLERGRLVKAQACTFTAGDASAVLKYTFSLSGLADRSLEPWARREQTRVPNAYYLRNHDAVILNICDNVVPLDRFIPRRNAISSTHTNRYPKVINDVYQVNPPLT
jgi:hypothetical protein